MGHLAPGVIFENMLQLTRFGLYFEGILSRKWVLSYRNSDRKEIGRGEGFNPP